MAFSIEKQQRRSMEHPLRLLLRATSFIPLPHPIISVSLLFSVALVSRLRQLLSFVTADVDLPSIPATSSGESPYNLLLHAALLIPSAHYYSGCLVVVLVLLYNLMEFHLLDIFRGDRVSLTGHHESEFYASVVSNCLLLRERYFASPWLASPHLQSLFVSIFFRAPTVKYSRELFCASDGATVALDWLRKYDVTDGTHDREAPSEEVDETPIVLVIPGFACDSDTPCMRHVAFEMARRGWNVCINNHPGFGGIAMTSDSFMNGGWTKHLCEVAAHIHRRHPGAAIFAVGTSVGANVLIKYLGEEGVDVPVVGAAAISCPWDLLLFDRHLNRAFVQRLYSRVMTLLLHSHLQVHHDVISRLADWELLQKTRSLRAAYTLAPCLTGTSKTVDMHYRESSSVNFVGKVEVPLLCINALDDPVSTIDAIPWDECRGNKNVVLATTKHGGHIAHIEGWTGSNLWWLRAVDEFFGMVNSRHRVIRINHGRVVSVTESLKLEGTHRSIGMEKDMLKTTRQSKHPITWSPRASST